MLFRQSQKVVLKELFFPFPFLLLLLLIALEAMSAINTGLKIKILLTQKKPPGYIHFLLQMLVLLCTHHNISSFFCESNLFQVHHADALVILMPNYALMTMNGANAVL